MSSFDIEIKSHTHQETYHLKGTYSALDTGEAFGYALAFRNCTWQGFGGGEWHRLPEISKDGLHLRLGTQILDAINKMIMDEKESANEFAKGYR